MGFNRNDHLYLGYNKLRAIVDPNHPRLTGCEVEGDFKASAEGALSMTGPSAKSNLESSKRIKYTALPGVDPAQRTQLLDVAEQTLDPLVCGAEEANSSTPYQAGSNYLYRGPCRFRHVTHDDWREDPENAPALALWLMELEDKDAHGSDARSLGGVTWILLSGTADGQLTTSETFDISTSRAGSQTEHLFEELYCHEFGVSRVASDNRWLQGHWRGTSARNMIGSSSQEMMVEILFRCHGVHSMPAEGEDRVFSYLGWSAASADGEALVTKLVVGSPFYVQGIHQQNPTKPDSGGCGLWQRLIRLFQRS